MSAPWLLVVSRPYYPEVTEYVTEQEARKALDDWMADNHAADGTHNAKAYIALATYAAEARTHY